MATIRCFHCESLFELATKTGAAVVCPACLRTGELDSTAPTADRMAADGDDDDAEEDRRPAPKKRASGGSDVAMAAGASAGIAGMGIGMILLIVGGLGACCLCVPGIGIALLVPAVQKVRDVAARTQSTNNMKLLAMGFHGFHDANKRLPFNGSNQAAGGVNYSTKAIGNNYQSGSWGFQILPYIDQQPLFNAPNQNMPVQTFLCPGRSRPATESNSGVWTDYFYNTYINSPTSASQPNSSDSKRTIFAITDGTSNTIMLGHGNIQTTQYTAMAIVSHSSNIFMGGTWGTARGGNNGEKSPAGWKLSRDSDQLPTFGSWGGPYAQGALIGMGDATVRMFPYTTVNFGDYLTPTGNEDIRLPGFDDMEQR